LLETAMATMPCPAAPLALVRPWPRRLADAFAERWRHWRSPRKMQEVDLATLAELSPKTLRDIGAPDWVQARARGQADPWMQTARDRATWHVL
jgi:hypothetical protein